MEKMTLEQYEELPKVKLADLWFRLHGQPTLVLVEYDQLWLDLVDFEVELSQDEINNRAELFLDLVRNDLIKEKYKL